MDASITPDPTTTACAVCGVPLTWRQAYRRLRDEAQAKAPPQAYTSTLVGGVMKPSCGEGCAGVLRGRAGAR